MIDNYQEDQLTVVDNWLERFVSIVDESRLNRGKRLFKQSSVIQYAKNNHGFTAKVRGSGRKVYDINADFTYDENGLPDLDDLYVECSCPDWVEYCKHSVCAVFFFSGELNHDFKSREAESFSEKHELKRNLLKRKVTMSEFDIYTLPDAKFISQIPAMPVELRKIHKSVRKKMKNHRYTP